ncbi:GNAT family N-acetyltransferase [Vallitalea guaymasensis]|uniref:GNAT family N-acetyltransferase n=1 Tax=Vallitalea guaymasensis TaxID=1185412 RepID=UPI000DE29B8E|nr:GNAT family protein [Vallitalea guaymasensis]
MFEYKVNNDISLRLSNVQDAEEVFKVIDSSRNHLKRWLTWVDLVKSANDCKYKAYKAMHQYASNNGFQCNVIYRGKIVGRLGTHSIDWSEKSTSLGYWLAENYQGRGIMTMCCKSFLAIIFNELKLNVVYVYVAEKNTKSRAIPERLHFEQKGINKNALILSGTNIDYVRYVMTRERYFQYY